ncbi:MAG: hypothetical protein ACFE9I_11765 [Candidatus Hermodarchaeota archaeon]
MKSQKWKIIVIKDPQLRRVRTNLRVILKEAIQSELRRLGYLMDLYSRKKVLTSSQEKRESMLIKISNNLLHF